MMEIREIAVLGSTGSIGTQTLDIIRSYPERFRARVLTAGRNWELLARQALEFRPRRVVIADPEGYEPLRRSLEGREIAVECGAEAIADAAAMPETDIVVTAMVGYSGLLPTIRAIKAGKRIALANKETLVVAGELITRLLGEYGSHIVPVDSEHSAIFQCLEGEDRASMRKIILTASGGAFRDLTESQLEHVKAADALKHPNWDMGAKVTVDSASMMNKGFEMIEAKWLFDTEPDHIEIAIHPQSIVHSMVEFHDGSIKAQLGVPDMRLPIRYALSYPERLPSELPPLQLSQYSSLTFSAPDMQRFPLLRLAFEAIGMGGNMPCILNAANEVAVAAFLRDRIRFVDMPRIVADTMEHVPFMPSVDLDALIETNATARQYASTLIKD